MFCAWWGNFWTMWLFISKNTWKLCNSWSGDSSSVYYRHDATNSSYNWVSFNENWHRDVSNKLVSVWVR
jgi:hypothetical protein